MAGTTTATNNTDALFFKQFDKVPLTNVNQALPCTIVAVKPGGFRVDVVVRDPANAGNVSGEYVERNVPFVGDGATPPARGFFVTPTDFAFPGSPTTPELGEANEGGTSSAD